MAEISGGLVEGRGMMEEGKETKMRIFYITAFLVMVLSLVFVHPLFADIEGDIELLRLIADGYEANLEKLRTWKGKVALKGFHTAVPSTDWGERQWQSQNEFLLDRDQDAIRWHGETVKGTQTIEGKTSPLPQDVHSGMIKGEYDYRLTFPENEKGRRNLLIIPSGQWPRNFESNVFDPIHILTKEIYPDVVGQLRYYHRLGGKMRSTGSITREGDIVTLQTGGNYESHGKIVTRFKFDLSKGCCLREFFTSSGTSESHWRLDYEKIADVFVMHKVALIYKDKREGREYVSTREAVLTNEMVNAPVDPAEFELDKLGMRPGDMVYDRVAGGVGYEWKADFTVPEMAERVSETVLIEAEGFDNLGGWVIDQQFMDQMGSPYLLAHGLGELVEDATTTVTFSATGLYRIWVRTRDWVAPWKAPGTPGKFQLLIDGKTIKTTFGTEGADWHWQDGGTVEIANKQVTLALHDLTGFEGRCDAIVLTSNMDFIPPNEGKEIAEFRRKVLGLPKQPQDAGQYNIVVVGGGIAGTCTAVSAARLGLQVALIQDRPVLGGNSSSEVRVHLGGKINLPPYPELGNIVKELDSGHHGNAGEAQFYDDQKKLRVIQAEQNISLFLNTHVYQVQKDGDRIVAVIGKNIRTSDELRFAAALFADCTGDGTVGYLAGADYRMGRESRDQTGELLASEKPDKMTLGTSVMWYSVETDEPTVFPECPWALKFTEESCQNATMGNWDWETGLYRDTVTEAEFIRDYMLRSIYGNWAFQKNNSTNKEKYTKRKLGWVAYIAGKRESRRLLGDVILQQQDIEQQREFPDAFVATTWSIDLHYPQPKNAEQFAEPFRAIAEQKPIKPHPIPYRCLYSRNIENLFMAGRDISVTHVALGTTRVMRTCGMMGELVGIAASLCKKHSTTPRGVYEHHLAELKELATRGVGRLNTKDEAFKKAAENGRLANEGFIRCRNFVKGWLNHADQKTGLIPRNLDKDKDIWNAQDCAADNYPFMVLTAAITDRQLFEGRMLDMLHTETKLTSRTGAMPDTYSFSKQDFQNTQPDIGRIIFGSSEYVKDGLLPLTEWLGESPWSQRMLDILDDIWKHAPIQTEYGKIISSSQEVNGEMLQTLSRIYWMTGDKKYLDWAIRLGDYYLLDEHHPTRDESKLRLRDHGCEIISGLCELYAAVNFAMPEKKKAYQGPIHEMLDRILEVGCNEHGLFYNSINPQTGQHDKELVDTWGYNLNGFYTVYLIDKIPAYRDAVVKTLSNLKEHYSYPDYKWGGSDDYADCIESAINLYNREPVPSVADWLDSEIKQMWNIQKPDGVIEGWHGDGNFARTTIMYCLWKTAGLTIQPWREDVIFGAVHDGDMLKITMRAEKAWQGKLIFDVLRHKAVMKMPLDWPRINQFPQWFTAESEKHYTVSDLTSNSQATYTGKQLHKGITMHLQRGTEHHLIVR